MRISDWSSDVCSSDLPSVSPTERFHVVPRPLSLRMIREIVAGYAAAARRLKAGGPDGVEIVASHGHLPGPFLNPRCNAREDEYGRSFLNPQRVLRESNEGIPERAGREPIVGIRLHGAELGQGIGTAPPR